MTAPTNQTFVSGTTISSEWLNGVNDHVNDLEVAAHTASNIEYLPTGTGAVATNVQAKLRSLELADYTALRAFTGNETHVQIIGTGISGLFKVDASDTTSADNGGTVLVDASGRRWKREYSGAVNVKWFGAKGDWNGSTGTIDDAAILSAYNAASDGLYFPASAGKYRISQPLSIGKHFFEIRGDGKNSGVVNTGTGAAFVVTKDYVSFQDIAIWGNGGSFGAGASGTYGIEFVGARAWTLSNVNLRYHGSHGVYCRSGVWHCAITNGTEILSNGGDGINAVSLSGATLDQNGNALSVVSSRVSLNNGNGISWKAANLNVTGASSIEANNGYGVLVDCTGLTNSAFGIDISGNYFENNVLGEIKFVSVSGVIVDGAKVTGNYFYSVQSGPLAMITFAGPTRSARGAYIAGNSIVTGGTVVNLVNGGDALREDCTIIPGAHPCINLGYAKLVQGPVTRTMLGAFYQNGLTWADPTGPSANFFSASTVTTYWELGLAEGQLLWDLNFFVESNCTAQYSLDCFIFSCDPTTGGVPAAIASISLNSDAGGGNKLFTYAPTVTSKPIRVAKNQKLYLRIRFTAPSTGSSIKMHDLVVRSV